MADSKEFFETYIPSKLESGALTGEGVYVFEIKGAGTWTLDIAAKTLTEGAVENPGCKITADKATWEAILDNPKIAVQKFMMGQIKATNIGMATKLQNILA